MPNSTKTRKLIVLAGAGYANLEILRKHTRSPFPNCEVLLIAPRPTKLLRSMIPWMISGEVRRQNAEIDLLRLCKVAGAQLILGEVDRVDLVHKAVLLKSGGSVYFDYLSISLGTEMKTKVQGPEIASGNRLEYIFDSLDRLLGKTDIAKIALYGDSPLSRLFLRGIARLKTPIELTLITDSQTFLQGLASFERLKINSIIKKLEAKVLTEQSIVKNENGKIYLSDSEALDTDLVIVADEGELPPLYSKSAFPIEDGKVCVNDALQLTNCKQVYVAGPGVVVQGHLVSYNPHRPSQKFGKVIAENLVRELKNKPLVVFRAEHALASWLPSAPERFSLGWQKMRSDRWKNWLSKRKIRHANSFVCASSGEVLRSDHGNTSLTLVCSQARLEDVEPYWVAQIIGRQILHQSRLKKIGVPSALQAHLSLRTDDSSKDLIRTKISQVQAGLVALNSSSVEVRVTSSHEDSIHLSSELTYKPNLNLKAGDLIYLVGRLGSVQGIHYAYEDKAHGESWYELRNQFNQDHKEFINTALALGAIDGSVLDERGLLRDLEDLIIPNNLGVSFDIDRIPILSVHQNLAVDRSSAHVRQNLEYARYLPEDIEPLLHHPRFLALFGAEISGFLLILPRDNAKKIGDELAAKYPQQILTPIGALTEGPVRYKFRLTTR